MLRGLTAHMLVRKIYPVGRGDLVLVHSAAGGLGQILTRWSKKLGASVVATVGSEGKVRLAKEAGADHVLLHTSAGWPEEVKKFADGRGVHLAIDGIGGETLAKTFGCVRPFGMVASVGQAAGSIPAVSVEELGPVRCISLSRPSVVAYTNDAELYRPAAADLFDALRNGLMNSVGAEYQLRDATQAHSDLETGRTTGSVILLA